MADKYLTLQTTPAGMNMIIRSLYGDRITFTRIAIGNGKPDDLNNVTELKNQILSVGITNADARADYLLLTGDISSADVSASFYGYELGVFAKGADNVERLYAYRYNVADVDFYPSSDSGRTLELTMTVVVQLGNAQNVTAILIEGEAYAKVNHTHAALDITSGIMPVERGGTGAGALTESDLTKVKVVKLRASGWGYSVPYTQEVEVQGVASSHKPVITSGMPDTINADNIKAMNYAYGMIDRAISGDGKITFYCYGDRPTTDVNVCVKGV